jgi:very-short-patch-repair endonuclease/ribosome maturation factor RimP
MGKEKLSFEFVKQYFRENECELLETNYINSKTKMRYKCKCQNESEIRFNNFQNGSRCKNCSGTEKYTYDFVKQYFKNNNCELLEKEYINANTNMKYKCRCQNESYTRFTTFKSGVRCRNCSGTERHTYEFVRAFFRSNGCELLETEYTNVNTKMKYKCKCGNRSTITFDSFRSGSRCRSCSGSEKHSFDYINEYFRSNGCELLESEYINANTKMKYKCKCGKASSIIFSAFQNGVRCMSCSPREKLTFEVVKKFFKDQCCALLETNYINTRTKMKYRCKCGHESTITFGSFQNGSRCNKCANKTERIVSEFLQKEYTNIIYQPKFDWCIKKRSLPFDFLLDDLKIIIEIDGPQHFKQVSNWKSPKETQKWDFYKMKCAIEHGYKIIRVFQEDIYYNNVDWKHLLQTAINDNNSHVTYISKNCNLYDDYKTSLKTI